MKYINSLKKIFNISFLKSQYLTLAEVINIGSSFLFFLIATNVFLESIIGFTSINISLFTNLSLISLLGFDYMIIRFKNELKDKFPSFISIIIISSLLSIIFTISGSIILLFLNIGTKYVINITDYFIYLIFLLIFCSSMTLGKLFDARSISESKNHWVLMRALISGFLRIAFLLVITFFNFKISNHILIMIYAISILLGDLSILIAYNYSGKRILKSELTSIIKDLRVFFSKSNILSKKYAFFNYISDIISRIPNFLFPIIVGIIFGEESAAFFYIAWMISNFIIMIYVSVSQTLIVEKTDNCLEKQTSTRNLVVSSILISILLTAGVIFFQDFILGLFGESYKQVDHLLVILLISSNIVGVLYIIAAYLRIDLNISALLIIFLIPSFLSIFFIIVLLFFIKKINIIGISWLIANSLTLIYGFYLIYQKRDD